MGPDVYRYAFPDGAPMPAVRELLVLAAFSAEGVHGRAQVRLDAAFHLDEGRRACVVDAATPVGRTIAQILTGLLTRQLGDAGFTVEHLDGAGPQR